MGNKKAVGLKYKGKKFKINLKVCNWLQRISGLMFTKREKAEVLLFEFKKPVRTSIHSWFVFFPFVAIWLDGKNEIIDLKRIKPFSFTICPEKRFTRIIEIPYNTKYRNVCKSLVGN